MHRSLSTPSNNINRLSNRNENQTPIFQRRRSYSTSGNCIIEKKRGFKPSDRFDPVKREFLVQLGKKFWCRPVRITALYYLQWSWRFCSDGVIGWLSDLFIVTKLQKFRQENKTNDSPRPMNLLNEVNSMDLEWNKIFFFLQI